MNPDAIICQIDAIRDYSARHFNVHGMTAVKIALAEALETVMSEIEQQKRRPDNAGDAA